MSDGEKVTEVFDFFDLKPLYFVRGQTLADHIGRASKTLVTTNGIFPKLDPRFNYSINYCHETYSFKVNQTNIYKEIE